MSNLGESEEAFRDQIGAFKGRYGRDIAIPCLQVVGHLPIQLAGYNIGGCPTANDFLALKIIKYLGEIGIAIVVKRRPSQYQHASRLTEIKYPDGHIVVSLPPLFFGLRFSNDLCRQGPGRNLRVGPDLIQYKPFTAIDSPAKLEIFGPDARLGNAVGKNNKSVLRLGSQAIGFHLAAF